MMQQHASPAQQFCLRWNNYQTNLTNVFDQLLHSESFVDVTLACDGRSIKAHKMVLSACSPYFQALFCENPCQHPIVIMRDIKWAELKAAVEFMYKGEINVAQDQIGPLLKVAESLKIRGLADVNGEHQEVAATAAAAAAVTPEMAVTAASSSAIGEQHSNNNNNNTMQNHQQQEASGGGGENCSSGGGSDFKLLKPTAPIASSNGAGGGAVPPECWTSRPDGSEGAAIVAARSAAATGNCSGRKRRHTSTDGGGGGGFMVGGNSSSNSPTDCMSNELLNEMPPSVEVPSDTITLMSTSATTPTLMASSVHPPQPPPPPNATTTSGLPSVEALPLTLPLPPHHPLASHSSSTFTDDMEIKPGIAEMIREEERAKLLESSHAWFGASTSSIAEPHPNVVKLKTPTWTQDQLKEAIEAVVTQKMRFTQASVKYGIPKGTLYDNILGKSKRMAVLEEAGLTPSEDAAVLEYCCEVSVSPYNRRTKRSLKLVQDFVEKLRRFRDPEFMFTGLSSFRWWWAFCKKHNIVSLYYENNNISNEN